MCIVDEYKWYKGEIEMPVFQIRFVIILLMLLCYVSNTVQAQIGIQRNPDYIGGPWVYTSIPCGINKCDHVDFINIDLLSKYTDGTVIERNFAEGKAQPEDILFLGGRLAWHIGFLGGRHNVFTENIGDLVDGVELNPGGHSNAVFYGLIVINVNKTSEVMMHLGYSAYAKIWINGEVAYTSEKRMWEEAADMTERISVHLKRGKNLIMAKVLEGIGWNLFVNFRTNYKISYQIKNGVIVVDDILPVEPSETSISTRWASLKKESRF